MEPSDIKQRLLDYFRGHAGRVISREELADKVWHVNFRHSRTIDQAIAMLRRTLPADEKSSPSIVRVTNSVAK